MISGQAIVDSIEKLSVDPTTSCPLTDVVIAHCGQVEATTSTFVGKATSWPNDGSCLESHKAKKRKLSAGDESENEEENDGSSASSDNDERKKKSKHSKKTKKKEKHRKRKEAKRLAKQAEQNTAEDNTQSDRAGDKNQESAGRARLETKTSSETDEIAEKTTLQRSIPNEKEKTNHDDPSMNERNSR